MFLTVDPTLKDEMVFIMLSPIRAIHGFFLPVEFVFFEVTFSFSGCLFTNIDGDW